MSMNNLRLSFLLFLSLRLNVVILGQTECSGYNPDVDNDNAITITDLLALLGLFEEVDADDDGIWDSQDECMGAVDICGICNGPGPTVLVQGVLECTVFGCMDVNASNFSASANTDDGSCVFGPEECGGISSVTYNGHPYSLVGIGEQCWFQENLQTATYNNGDPIPGSLTNNQWASTMSGAQAIPNNDPANLSTFGRLYNGYAVNDVRGLCPSGFHVPTSEELNVLMERLDGPSIAGLSMKVTPSHSPPWDGDNSSNFTALPGGWRDDYFGQFMGIGSWADFWTGTAWGNHAQAYGLLTNNHSVSGFNASYRYGAFVRCIKD
jgi:uncharacterized protein (TIGR02145 family)